MKPGDVEGRIPHLNVFGKLTGLSA